MSETEFDIAVIGGGLSGYGAALGAAQRGLRVFHAAPVGRADPRTSALMMPTLAFLQELGVFDADAPLGVPLAHIHIIDCTRRLVRAGETVFSAQEIGATAFGYNIANGDLLAAMQAGCSACAGYVARSSFLTGLKLDGDGPSELEFAEGPSISAVLVVGADGKGSPVREMSGIGMRQWAYPQAALVCNLECGLDHEATSFELHYEMGPFTLVPAGGRRSNLVWVDDPAVLERALNLPVEEFQSLLAEKSHGILGDLTLTSKRFVFPLAGGRADCFGRDGHVLVGEAAHYFPPIGAQGLNLGLRDVADLMSLLAVRPLALHDVAAAYDDARQRDISQTTLMVDMLNRSLLSGFLPVQMARSVGIWALGNSGALRQRAFRSGMGAGSDAPAEAGLRR